MKRRTIQQGPPIQARADVAVWRTRVPSPIRLFGVRVDLAYTRSDLHAVELRVGSASIPLRRSGTSFVGKGDLPALETGVEVALVAVYAGDVPLPVRVVLYGGKHETPPEPLQPLWVERTHDQVLAADVRLPRAIDRLWTREVRRHGIALEVVEVETEQQVVFEPTDPAALATSIHAERALAVDAHHRVQRFFLELDRRTDANLVSPGLLADMDVLRAELAERLAFRSYFIQPPTPEGVDFHAPSAAVADAAQRISTLFVDCAQELAGHAWGSEELLAWAFELFVAGRIAVTHRSWDQQELLFTHGAPDSWNYFLFTELALLCLQLGHDETLWGPALPALVRTAELLCLNGTPGGANLTSGERALLFAHRDGKVLLMADLAATRDVYGAHLNTLQGPDRIRDLADSLAFVVASAGFGTYTSVYSFPGTERPTQLSKSIGT